MGVTLSTAARNAACDAIVDLLDGGTIEFRTSGDVEVATLGFGTPAFGDAAAGVATANAITSDTNATGGTIAKASVRDSGDAEIMELSVGTVGSGEDIELTSLVIAATETVSMSALTFTIPAS